MLLNAVIIVLRETLEAGILMSVLLTISRQSGLGQRWFVVALAMGLVGAGIYARYLGEISLWFDYAGQEVVNAFLQYALYICLVVICLMNGFSAQRASQRNSVMMLGLLMVSVMLASIREGSEIIIFFTGYMSSGEALVKALTSGFVGLMIGGSVGALCYYAIILQKADKVRAIQTGVLTLVAAGMVAQASQLLVQVDWLPSAAALWNTSDYLSESSILGQLAYATFGYEASPTPVEAVLYIVSLLLIPAIFVGVYCYRKKSQSEGSSL
ncbi:hypothetical protein G8770_05495 [Aestuariicella hydrocarbonica]|uniref:Iron permease n=1 Tax=Pseudomaricurvus hydrocarbonicus TaxID=1470433 RepID=A0A9E5JR57_9GAMM|nr:hypothetical protein [Aestuariicella hydrocarbonica]